MRTRSWEKDAAALVCALLLWTPEVQATQQIGKAVSSSPGEAIPSVSARRLGSLDSPDVIPAALSLSGSSTDKPANLAPAPGLTPESGPPARPEPETVTVQTPPADNVLSETSLTESSGSQSPAPIKGHAVAAAQSAADPRPTRGHKQFSLAQMFKGIMVVAMLLGISRSLLVDARKIEPLQGWANDIQTHLQGLADTAAPAPGSTNQALGTGLQSFMRHISEIDYPIYRKAISNEDEKAALSLYLQRSNYPDAFLPFIGNRSTPWSEEDLQALYNDYRENPDRYQQVYVESSEIPYSYEFLQNMARAHAFYLQVRRNPNYWYNHPEELYLRFNQEVELRNILIQEAQLKRKLDIDHYFLYHPRTLQRSSEIQRFNTQVPAVFYAAKSRDREIRKLFLKLFLLSVVAAIIAVTPFSRLWRKTKSAYFRMKTASRSGSTPLMGAALFALPGPGALLGAINGWAVAGITLAAAALTALSFLAWRRRVKPQFSLSNLFKAIAIIAIMLGSHRMYLDAGPLHSDWRSKISSQLEQVLESASRESNPEGAAFCSFMHYIQNVHDYIYIAMEAEKRREEGKSLYDDFMLEREENRYNFLSAMAMIIGAKQNPLSLEELQELYRKYTQDYPNQAARPHQFEYFQFTARAHEFYLEVRKDPQRWSKEPFELYLKFIREVELKYSPINKRGLQQLEERAKAVNLDERMKRLYLDGTGLGSLILSLILGPKLWRKWRQKKSDSKKGTN